MRQVTEQSKVLRENVALVRKIANKFREGDSVRWKKAFTEHPEWEKTLIGKDGKMYRLHIFANQLNKKGELFEGDAPRQTALPAARRNAIRAPRANVNNDVSFEGMGTVDGRAAKFSIAVHFLE